MRVARSDGVHAAAAAHARHLAGEMLLVVATALVVEALVEHDMHGASRGGFVDDGEVGLLRRFHVHLEGHPCVGAAFSKEWEFARPREVLRLGVFLQKLPARAQPRLIAHLQHARERNQLTSVPKILKNMKIW